MKIYIAAFIVMCGITSLANSELSFSYDPKTGTTTTINTIGGITFVSDSQGNMKSVVTFP